MILQQNIPIMSKTSQLTDQHRYLISSMTSIVAKYLILGFTYLSLHVLMADANNEIVEQHREIGYP